MRCRLTACKSATPSLALAMPNCASPLRPKFKISLEIRKLLLEFCQAVKTLLLAVRCQVKPLEVLDTARSVGLRLRNPEEQKAEPDIILDIPENISDPLSTLFSKAINVVESPCWLKQAHINGNNDYDESDIDQDWQPYRLDNMPSLIAPDRILNADSRFPAFNHTSFTFPEDRATLPAQMFLYNRALNRYARDRAVFSPIAIDVAKIASTEDVRVPGKNGVREIETEVAQDWNRRLFTSISKVQQARRMALRGRGMSNL